MFLQMVSSTALLFAKVATEVGGDKPVSMTGLLNALLSDAKDVHGFYEEFKDRLFREEAV